MRSAWEKGIGKCREGTDRSPIMLIEGALGYIELDKSSEKLRGNYSCLAEDIGTECIGADGIENAKSFTPISKGALSIVSGLNEDFETIETIEVVDTVIPWEQGLCKTISAILTKHLN